MKKDKQIRKIGGLQKLLYVTLTISFGGAVLLNSCEKPVDCQANPDHPDCPAVVKPTPINPGDTNKPTDPNQVLLNQINNDIKHARNDSLYWLGRFPPAWDSLNYIPLDVHLTVKAHWDPVVKQHGTPKNAADSLRIGRLTLDRLYLESSSPLPFNTEAGISCDTITTRFAAVDVLIKDLLHKKDSLERLM